MYVSFLLVPALEEAHVKVEQVIETASNSMPIDTIIAVRTVRN